jgi:hypothetical protein
MATNNSNAGVGYVQVQTLRNTTGGTTAALAAVQTAVAAHNAKYPKAVAHTCVSVTALPNNTKGMQWQLALLATLARQHGATMVRLSVHNGAVALCGTPAAIAATQAAMVPAYNAYSTAASNAYNPAAHGNRVGFTNGYLCGCPAGLQAGLAITATLQYGLGYLFTFAAPGSGSAYAIGYAAALATAKTATKPAVATKPRKAPTATAPTATAPTATAPTATAVAA